MNNPKATEQKDEVLRLLREHESIAAPLQQDAAKVVETVQANRDIAGTVSKLVSGLSSDSAFPESTWNALRQTLQGQNDTARATARQLGEMSGIYGIQSSVVANVASSTVMVSFNSGATVGPEVTEAAEELNAIVARYPALQDARSDLKRLGVDRPHPQKKNALNLLQEATEAIDAPTGSKTSPVAVLISVREAIDRAIEDLFQRCVGQERAKSRSEKILSIGRRCGKVSAPTVYFQNIAERTNKLMDQLSGAKRDSMTREEIRLRFNEALLLLKSFVAQLDETRLRT